MLRLAVIRVNERDGSHEVMLEEEVVQPVMEALQRRFFKKGAAAEAALAALHDVEQKLRTDTHSLT